VAALSDTRYLPRSVGRRRSIFFHHIASLALVLFLSACDLDQWGLGLPPDSSRPAGRDFVTAPLLELDSVGNAKIGGRVSVGTIDVWDIGPVQKGDRIIFTAKPTLGSGLDPLAAIFDNKEDVFSLNDDVDFTRGRLDSRIDKVVREASPRFYIAVTASFFTNTSGNYVADVEVQRGQSSPPPKKQKLLLNFAGVQNVTIPNVGTFNFLPFDAARVHPAYANHTQRIKDGIVDIVKERFSRFNVEILTSDDGTTPDTPGVSTLYFGEYSRTTFGISQQVDFWNADCCDDGIIFTDNFVEVFAVRPSVDGVAVAIGNVAAHEGGHLLGLSHVADITDLMDTTGVASTLLENQQFKRSRLDRSIFPIGFQDGPKMLFLTVGSNPSAP
jgi:hypothetical protein